MTKTSFEAYENVKASGKLNNLQLEVFRYVCGACDNGQAPTAREVAESVEGHQIDSIRPRFAELERRGVIRKAGERVCAVTKERAVTWEPTGELPGDRKPRAESKTTLLRAELESLKTTLSQLETIIKEIIMPLKYITVSRVNSDPVAIVFPVGVDHNEVIPANHKIHSAGFFVISQGTVIVLPIGSTTTGLNPAPQDRETIQKSLGL